MASPREYGVDLLKIIACAGVVVLHTINGTLGTVHYIITLISSLCIPLFLVSNGYLMFLKESISCRYILNKIMKILIVCFSWEALHAIVYYLYYHKTRNFIKSFVLDFLQKGLFYHFWFMGVLVILYLLLPLLRIINQKKPKLYLIILSLLCIICVAIDGISILVEEQIQLQIIQTFRLWMWLFYYMFGGLIATYSKYISKFVQKHRRIKFIGVLSLVVIWQWMVENWCFEGHYRIEGGYGSWSVILGTIIVFSCIYKIEISKKGINVIKKIIPCVMGIYIVHPFILALLIHFIPVFASDKVFNLIYCLVTVFISSIISWIISKIPFLCRLIKI